jgi:hypothetical protein
VDHVSLVRRLGCQARVRRLGALRLLLARVGRGGVRQHSLRTLPGRGVSLAAPVLRDPQSLLQRHPLVRVHAGVHLVDVYLWRGAGRHRRGVTGRVY